MKYMIPLLLLCSCVSSQPGMMDPEAIGPSINSIATEYKAYVTADATLTEISRAAKAHEADVLMLAVSAAMKARETPATPEGE
jgi:hypothetical protein